MRSAVALFIGTSFVSATASLVGPDFVVSDLCSIPVVRNLSLADFRARFKGVHAVVFSRPLSETTGTHAALQRDTLLEAYGDKEVELVDVASFTHRTRRVTLSEYVTKVMVEQTPDTPAADSWYLFGEALGPVWRGLVADYPMPMDAAEDAGIRAWGCGARFSGVNFHKHGAAFSEVLHGRKRWYVSPPDKRPDFSPHKTQLEWVLGHEAPVQWGASAVHASEGALNTPQPLACTLSRGDVLYLPPGWWHATLNLNLEDWTAAVSVFTMEHSTGEYF